MAMTDRDESLACMHAVSWYMGIDSNIYLSVFKAEFIQDSIIALARYCTVDSRHGANR